MVIRRKNEKGAATVELALLMPILVLIIFGIAEFGFVFNRWMSVTHSARDGVRRYALGEPAADAETSAETTTPNLTGAMSCTATQPAVDQVQMACSTTYNLNLLIINTPIDIESTALMRKE